MSVVTNETTNYIKLRLWTWTATRLNVEHFFGPDTLVYPNVGGHMHEFMHTATPVLALGHLIFGPSRRASELAERSASKGGKAAVASAHRTQGLRWQPHGRAVLVLRADVPCC